MGLELEKGQGPAIPERLYRGEAAKASHGPAGHQIKRGKREETIGVLSKGKKDGDTNARNHGVGGICLNGDLVLIQLGSTYNLG